MNQLPRPAVSAVIPVFNRREYVVSAIRSAIGQTLEGVEVVVVDDGSTDGLTASLDVFGSRINVFHQDNRGPGAARNLGVSAARGDYIAFLDSDDEWLPDHVLSAVRYLEANRDIVWTSCNYWVLEPDGLETLRNPPGSASDGGYSTISDWFSAYPSSIATTTSGVVIRRSAFVSTGGFDEHARSGHDYDMWFRVAASYGRLGYSQTARFRYRAQVPGSVTASARSLHQHKLVLLERHIDWELQRSIDDTRRRRVVDQSRKFIRKSIALGRPDLARRMVRALRPLVGQAEATLLGAATLLSPGVAQHLGRLTSGLPDWP